MEYTMDEFEMYCQMRSSGVSPARVYQIARANGNDDIACLRLLRHVFSLSLVEAKSVIIEEKEQVAGLELGHEVAQFVLQRIGS